ncbi:hypothetical protein JCM10450v2_001094 [Rhodotorula kratochvilovae]
MSKRSRDPLDDPRSGPSKNALRGLSYVGQQPKFLQNAMAALSGQTASAAAAAGRAPVPTRPDGDDGRDSDDELDGATVVVLKEGKHLDQDEVDRLRAEAKANDAEDPFAAGAAEPERVRNTGSLSFSSGAAGRAKGAKSGGGGQGDWADVVKRSQDDDGIEKEGKGAPAPAPAPAKTAEDKAKEREKAEKRKKKEKKVAQKKIGMLSFGEEE